jgi:hypothetical protein
MGDNERQQIKGTMLIYIGIALAVANVFELFSFPLLCVPLILVFIGGFMKSDVKPQDVDRWLTKTLDSWKQGQNND